MGKVESATLNKIFSIFAAAAIVICCMFIFVEDAYAGTASSPGSTSGGGSGNASALNKDNYYQTYWKTSYTGSEFGQNTTLGAYVTHPNAVDFVGQVWLRWEKFFEKSWPGVDRNGQLFDPWNGLDPTLQDQLIKDHYGVGNYIAGYNYTEGYQIGVKWWWSPSNGRCADAVWVDRTYTPREDTAWRLLKVTDSDGNVLVDNDTGVTWESLYNNPTSNGSYQHTFDTKGSYKVYARYVLVKHSYTEVQEGSNVWYENHSYGAARFENVERTINYNYRVPELNKQLYSPLNLNTNGYASDELVRSTFDKNFVSSGKIAGSVDNLQGIMDGTALQAVDLNLAVPFKFALSNNQFGLPESMHFTNRLWSPTAGEVAADGDPFTQGVVSSPGGPAGSASEAEVKGFASKDKYSQLAMMYGSNGGKLDSIQINGKSEQKWNANIAYDEAHPRETGGWFNVKGGVECWFRSIKQGGYGLSSDPSSQWWVAQYTQSRSYTSGATVAGTISGNYNVSERVSVPSIVDNGAVTSKTNHVVRMQKEVVNQPLLYGLFQVETVRGMTE